MRRSTILILFTLVFVGAVVGGYVLYTRNVSEGNENVNQPVQASNTNGNSVSTPPIVKGDITINKSVTYRGVTFAVDTALKASAYRRSRAPENTTYVVLFLKPFTTAPTEDPLTWATADIRLTPEGGTPLVPYEISLPTAAGVSGGYLWFTVPTTASNLSLEFGSGTTQQVLELDLDL